MMRSVSMGRPPIRVPEGLAFEAFHGNESQAMFLADVMNCADIRVIESGGGLGFAAEPAQGLRILASSSGRNFKATKRSRRVSCALYTTPMPPPPSFSMML
jgi:hypothetical protein